MVAGKGQPPKATEDKRVTTTIGFSPKEKAKIEAARDIEAPEKGFTPYVREAALNHSEDVLNEAESDNGKK